MLKNALRRAPGSTPFVCLFCKPSTSNTLSPLRISFRTFTTAPLCLKNRSLAAIIAAKKARSKPKPEPEEVQTDNSALDEMKKGIDAIVAKQLAADPVEKVKKKKEPKAKKPKSEIRKKKALARLVNSKRKTTVTAGGMTLAEAMAKGAEGGSKKKRWQEEEEEVAKTAPRPAGLKSVDPDAAGLEPIEMPGHQNPPNIHHDLDRVLFNPGVHHLQDPRSRVYNFEPYLRDIMPVHEFDFEAVDSYITSSKDKKLERLAKSLGKKYSGSTSSMTSILSHFHYLLSHWRGINAESMSKGFPVEYRSFTQLSRAPVATFLRYKGDGTYAIDADKEFDTDSILSLLGRSLEKMLTLPPAEYESLRRANAAKRDGNGSGLMHHPDTFHYSTLGDFLMRSQLDAYDPRLPGTGMFDLKTRAVVSVRMDVANFHLGSGYQIKTLKGQWESFEREYFDMIRAAFLKYSLQVRMGRMDGIFVAFHNTERIFGFQYIGLDEMDSTIHGSSASGVGEKEFKASLVLLNQILDRATEKFPERSLRLHFETRETQTPQMYIIAEPVSEKQIEKIQNRNTRDMNEFLKSLEEKRESVMKKAESKKVAEKFGVIEEEEPVVVVAEGETAAVAEQEAGEEAVEDVEEIAREESFEHGQQVSSLETEVAVESVESVEATEEVVAATEEVVVQETVEEISEEITEEVSAEPEKFEESEDASEESEELEESREASEEAVELEESREVSEESEELGEFREASEAGELEESREVSEESEELREFREASEAGELEESREASEESEEPEEPREVSEELEELEVSDEAASETSKTSKPPPPKSPKPPILGMTLTTYNLVNGRPVLRPEHLSKADKWTIEYNIVEAQTTDRAWNTYNSIKLRRKKAAEHRTLTEDSDEISGYVKYLRALSKGGRTWAAEQEKAFSGEPVVYKAGGRSEK